MKEWKKILLIILDLIRFLAKQYLIEREKYKYGKFTGVGLLLEQEVRRKNVFLINKKMFLQVNVHVFVIYKMKNFNL